jgi:hypothetical protein
MGSWEDWLVKTPPIDRGFPTRHELSELSVRLQGEYQSRFDDASREFVIGSRASSRSLGIGIEIDRKWYAFPVAERGFRKGWALGQGARELETTLRQFLDRQLT